MSYVLKNNTSTSPTRNTLINKSSSTIHTIIPITKPNSSLLIRTHSHSSFSNNLITPDRVLMLKKKHLKEKFLSTIHNKLILNRTMYDITNAKFHFENEMHRRESKAKELLRISHAKKHFTVNRRSFIFTKRNELFSKYKTTYRYEDIHESPYEVIQNNFTQDEIALMQRSPQYFLLTRPPFNECGLKFNITLKDVLNEEEGNANSNNKAIRGKKVVENFYKVNTSCKGNEHKRKVKCKYKSKSVCCNSSNKGITGCKVNEKGNKYMKKGEENEINKKYLYSAFYYDKLFSEIEERKLLMQLKRQRMLKYKKEKFELMKNAKRGKGTNDNGNDIDMYKARKVVNIIERNFMKKMY